MIFRYIVELKTIPCVLYVCMYFIYYDYVDDVYILVLATGATLISILSIIIIRVVASIICRDTKYIGAYEEARKNKSEIKLNIQEHRTPTDDTANIIGELEKKFHNIIEKLQKKL